MVGRGHFFKKIFLFSSFRKFLKLSNNRYIYIYGLQQPGCILCRKLLIFCFSLSHFCDLFWNVPLITNICFIWQFCGQNIYFEPVSPPKNILGPPGAPKNQQKLKTFLNLLLNMADTGWLWLTLAASRFTLMTLADSGRLWLSARVS